MTLTSWYKRGASFSPTSDQNVSMCLHKPRIRELRQIFTVRLRVCVTMNVCVRLCCDAHTHNRGRTHTHSYAHTFLVTRLPPLFGSVTMEIPTFAGVCLQVFQRRQCRNISQAVTPLTSSSCFSAFVNLSSNIFYNPKVCKLVSKN